MRATRTSRLLYTLRQADCTRRLSASRGHEKVEALVQAKVHTLAKNEYSTTALEYAEGKDHWEVLVLLKQLIRARESQRAQLRQQGGGAHGARRGAPGCREQSARVDESKAHASLEQMWHEGAGVTGA